MTALEICQRNLARARAERDAYVAQVSANAGDDWNATAYRWLKAFAFTKAGAGPWSGEDAVDYAHAHGCPRAHDDRAWGGVFRKAQGAGVIARSDKLFQRRKGHASVAPGWTTV